MTSWLLPASIAAMLASLLILVIFIVVYRKDREQFIGIWIIGWGFHCLRYAFESISITGFYVKTMTVAAQEATAISAVLLLMAALKLISNKKLALSALLTTLLLSGWIITANLLFDNFLIITLPTFIYFGFVLIAIGYIFHRFNRGKNFLGARLVSWSMVFWGFHKFDYPFLRHAAWFAPIGFSLSAILAIVVGIGILLLLFERLEEKAKTAAERFRAIFNSSQDAIYLHDIKSDGLPGFFIEINKVACGTMGYTREEFLGMTPKDLADPSGHASPPILMKDFSRNPHILFRMDHVTKNGAIIPHEINATIINFKDKLAVLSIARDISQRLATEKKLKESHERLLAVLDGLEAVVYVTDMQTNKILYANKYVIDIFGDVQGKICWQTLQRKQTGPCSFCTNEKLLDDKGKPTGVYAWELKNNVTGKWYDVRDRAIRWLDGRLARLEIATDITDRKKMEMSLQAELDRSTALADLSARLLDSGSDIRTIASLVLEKAQQITSSAHGFVSLIDPVSKDNLCISITEMMPGECRVPGDKKSIAFPCGPDGRYPSLWGHALNTGEPFFVNDPTRHASSRTLPIGHVPIHRFLSVPVYYDKELVGQIALANPDKDYTDRDLETVAGLGQLYALAVHRQRQLEDKEKLAAELRQSQKMEAIGTLAGGIAHDFNNILYAIMGYAELSMIDAPRDYTLQHNLREIVEAGQRAADLVKQILTFSRKSDREKHPVAIQHVVKEVLKLLRGTLPTTIDIKQNIDSECRPVLADVTQIHQVMVNLCTNAYHAMRNQGGILEVNLEETEITNADTERLHGLPTGTYVRLQIKDTGHGMDQATMNRIFEPYFTTKKTGEGTGLGLSTVQGIVLSHNGYITVQSEQGQGTMFEVHLPVLSDRVPSEEKKKQPSLPKLRGHVLFVDDEEMIASLGEQILSAIGCTVVSFTSSLQALEAFRGDPDAFDAVVTDQTMPGMTGVEMAHAILAIRPKMPIVLATGYSEAIDEQDAERLGIRKYIMKPLSIEALSAVMAEVLAKT